MDFSEYCDKNQNINAEEKRFSRNNNFSKNSPNCQKNTEFKQKNTQNQAKTEQFFQNEKLKGDIEQQLSKYQNMSSSELQQELFKEASKQKQSGNLDAAKLEEIKSTLLPMLNQEQQQRLNSLIEMLK